MMVGLVREAIRGRKSNPVLLANKRIEAQSELKLESNGENHEKSKEARQIEGFIETTR
jgi:hypothetical protein